ncbi:PREDICTED: protein trichome birefringence-like 34 [Erythranthe guttata]|uniref:protein trichome birefringence-like 34 n=1 Tax=Erythranthe guttata TaxID=4155 RepID=UPI00064E0973|nr:PREDICTED: protein trichome birefringence-like 34 [Erythranthe guttata]|eukprot:XP_012831781.1 PREDICTED: protein trichome birefringence-like 34 [Erythranthe guttata]
MEDNYSCEKHGRKDLKYQHWRWQPHNCDIPMFNGTALLEKLRGKKLIFVGDSMNRNQLVSFLCLIDPFLPKSSNKKLILKGNLYYFHDTEYNTTIGLYWSPYLVESNADLVLTYRAKGRAVRIDSIENHARHWNDADFLVFDTYVWWSNPMMTLM